MFPETSGLNFHQAHAVSWNMAFLVSTLESVVCLLYAMGTDLLAAWAREGGQTKIGQACYS